MWVSGGGEMDEIEDRWEKLKLKEEEALNIDCGDADSEELNYKEDVYGGKNMGGEKN